MPFDCTITGYDLSGLAIIRLALVPGYHKDIPR